MSEQQIMGRAANIHPDIPRPYRATFWPTERSCPRLGRRGNWRKLLHSGSDFGMDHGCSPHHLNRCGTAVPTTLGRLGTSPVHPWLGCSGGRAACARFQITPVPNQFWATFGHFPHGNPSCLVSAGWWFKVFKTIQSI